MSPIPFEAPSLEQLSELLPAYDFSHLISLDDSGAIFQARQRSLDRDVAIRILPRELSEDPHFQQSFSTAAKQMARLSDRNLIKIYDYGDADGLLFTVMEYVHGKSLSHSTSGKMIDARQAVEIVLAACNGLAHAHENGIAHRNLGPTKILLNEKREPKIGGFGLTSPAENLTSYSAPEAIIDQDGKGYRMDVYSVGVILKEMLTGFPANTAAFEYAEINDASLARICATAMAENPALRYANLDRLRQSLDYWHQPKPASTPAKVPTTPRPLPQRSLASAQPSRVNWPLMNNCAIIVFLLGAIALTWNLYTRKQEFIAEQAKVALEAPAKPAVNAQASENPSKKDMLASSSRY